jgi:hypothetical protein
MNAKIKKKNVVCYTESAESWNKNEIILKDLCSLKSKMLNSTWKYRYDSFQLIWDSHIPFLNQYQVTLENRRKILKLENPVAEKKGFKTLDIQENVYYERKQISINLSLVKQILDYNKFLLKGTLTELLKGESRNQISVSNRSTMQIFNEVCLNINQIETLDINVNLLYQEFKKYKKSGKPKHIYQDLFDLMISYISFVESRNQYNYYIKKKFNKKNIILFSEEYNLLQIHSMLTNLLLLPLFLNMICLLYFKLKDEKCNEKPLK